MVWNRNNIFIFPPIGQELLDHKSLFLSQKAIQSFGGYANSQLRRLDNKSARLTGQAQREQHILNSIQNASYDFKERYFSYTEDNIHLYLDSSPRDDMEAEIYMDLSLKHYPLRDYRSMWNEMNSIVRDYDKLGKRNKHAIEHAKLSKHMMHLVRLYLMAFDILEKEKSKIHTMGLLDTLEYLKKGGRISSTVAFIGGALAIKPVVAVSDRCRSYAIGQSPRLQKRQ